MCEILLSIHPEFVEKIVSGEKKFEFRKIKTKKEPNKIIIYSTSPVSAIVGEAAIEEVLIDKPNQIWSLTKEYSGVKKEYFLEYFYNKDYAIAYKLKDVKVYDKPQCLIEYGISQAPQSFMYL